jgi:hypothetical protein
MIIAIKTRSYSVFWGPFPAFSSSINIILGKEVEAISVLKLPG